MTTPATVLVSRRETFNAAHQLFDPGAVRRGEQARYSGSARTSTGTTTCSRSSSPARSISATGYVFDLKQLSDVISRRIVEDVDHRNLNTDVPWLDGRIPTAENLAVAFWERIRPELPEGTLRSVRLWETDKNWVVVGDPL